MNHQENTSATPFSEAHVSDPASDLEPPPGTHAAEWGEPFEPPAVSAAVPEASSRGEAVLRDWTPAAVEVLCAMFGAERVGLWLRWAHRAVDVLAQEAASRAERMPDAPARP